MSFEQQVTIARDHPSLAGHFPGNPVVPGVVILDQVRIALNEWQPEAVIESLPQVKFAMPLLPDQAMSICLEEHAGRIRFQCHRQGDLITQGEFRLKAVT